ncbi:MAG: AAA family ATPase [bacterium]
MAIKKQLPIGISTLEEIIKNDLLYIDKTEIIHRLITNNRRCFFSRPRRFGKSLLVSTLKEIFSGNKELFKNLWIGKENRYTWVNRPVVHLDFAKINYEDLLSLKQSLNLALDRIARTYNVSISHATSPDDKITELVSELGLQEKVAVLIDEYDAPLLKHIDDVPTALAMREVLGSFYNSIKGLDEYIYFTFATGVTKFSKTSLFSGPNNLLDISLHEKYATLCGYTEQEIAANFSSWIAEVAEIKKSSTQKILDEMRTWYNGYQMSDYLIERVYNPFSVLLFLENKKLRNYWFTSGNPTYLIKLIQEHTYDFSNIDHSLVSSADLDSFDISTQNAQGQYKPLPLPMLMLQSGYLTIEKFNERAANYILTYPNQEIRESLNQLALCASVDMTNSKVDSIKEQLFSALQEHNVSLFCSVMQSLLAHIPYHLHQEQEAFYHAIVHIVCILLQINAESEIAVARGRADMVVQTTTTIYVFELKLNASPEVALTQIHEKKYYERYLRENKEICLVGLNFEYATKMITYCVDVLAPHKQS